MLPNFVVIGAMKAGTTSRYRHAESSGISPASPPASRARRLGYRLGDG
jgi:hypothetical protein